MTTLADIQYQRRVTVKVVTHVSPQLKDQINARHQATGIPISEVLRRCLVLWVQGELDEMLPHAGQ